MDQKKYLKKKKIGTTGTTDWVNFTVISTAIQLQPQPPKIRCPRDASKSRAAVLEQSRRPTDVKLIALRVLKKKDLKMMDDDKSNKCFFDNPFLDKCLFFLWCWSFELKRGRVFSMSLNATSTGGIIWSAAHLTSMVLSVKDILLFASGRKRCNSVSKWIKKASS